jgi:hypothetical protein
LEHVPFDYGMLLATLSSFCSLLSTSYRRVTLLEVGGCGNSATFGQLGVSGI